MKNLTQFVEELANSFQVKERDDGQEFYCTKDDAPDYVTELCRHVHDGMMPDDYRYEFLVDALNGIDEQLCSVDSLDDLDRYYNIDANVYTVELLRWLASNIRRTEYVDECLQEFEHTETSALLMHAQELEQLEVTTLVLDWLRLNADVLYSE